MKRSEMIKLMMDHFSYVRSTADEVLNDIENVMGMQPPAVKSVKIRGEDHRWGGGCSMSCNCDDCNPHFLVNKWEPE